jgi:dienelactone hydrolase
MMNTTTTLTPADARKFDFSDVMRFAGQAGRALRHTLEGLAWGLAAGGTAGAMIAMAMLGWSFNSPFGKLIDQAGIALMMLVVIGTLGGLSTLIFWLARQGLARLYRSPRRILRFGAAAPYFIFCLIPLPLVFVGLGIFLSSQLYSWFPGLLSYFMTIQGPAAILMYVEAALAAVAGAVLIWRPRWWAGGLGLIPVAAVNLALVLFAAWPGHAEYLVTQPVSPAVAAQQLDLANPGLPGKYAVQACSYGSGSDLRRPEYGEKACWSTPVLDQKDAMPVYDAPSKEYYRWFWGFDYGQLPLNARVWAPVGQGPFPLALIVHGNHMMGDYSEGGYTYLGEHLASQGFIAVSLDENFLNGFFMADMGMKEIPLRAWMMLKHIQQWQSWNADPQHPFYRKVDLNQIAVMGHSRGGESAVMAAVLNRMSQNPMLVKDDFNFNFNIRAVVEIAPSEGSNKINYKDFEIEGASYLLLQGAHDSDAYMLNGIRQYARVRLEQDLFKTTVYSYRANHGQFNTAWGYGDYHPTWMLNTEPLVSAEQQEMQAKVFITAFLKAALQGQNEYRAVFQRPWATAAWTQDNNIVLTRYQESSTRLLMDYDGYVKEYSPVEGVTASEAGFMSTELESLVTREPKISQNNTALRLTWEQPGAEYSLSLPDGAAAGARGLTFALAPADEQQPAADLTVELEDAAGRKASLALGDAAALPVLLPAQLVKVPQVAELAGIKRSFEKPAERFLQTETLAFEQFQAEPGFDHDSLKVVRLRFDRVPSGAVLLDEVGLVK